jgi:hypothetical protein
MQHMQRGQPVKQRADRLTRQVTGADQRVALDHQQFRMRAL